MEMNRIYLTSALALLLVLMLVGYASARPIAHLSSNEWESGLINDQPIPHIIRNLLFLSNRGDETLIWRIELESIHADSATPPLENWIIVDQDSGNLEAGAVVPITYGMITGNLNGGSHIVDIHFLSNDPADPDQVFRSTLNINGVPLLDVLPDPLDFSEAFEALTAGQSYSLPLRLFNDGTDDLDVQDIGWAEASDQFQIEFNHGVVRHPGEYLNLPVTFQAAEPGDYEADLVITSNDPNEGERHVHLQASIAGDRVRGGLAPQPPTTFAITSISPNPFNSTTTISYNIARPGFIRLGVFDIEGRQVGTLRDGFAAAGSYRAEWSAAGTGSGSYVIRLEGPDGVNESRKMMLTK
jgi:hypothetical protein